MKTSCLVATVLLLWAGPSSSAPPRAGSKVPAVAFSPIGDRSAAIPSSQLFRGHTTLVSFFATWCEDCKKEMTELNRLQTRFQDRGFQVVLVCLDLMGARNVGNYLEEAGGVGLSVYCDPSGAVGNRFGVTQLPTAVLIGPDEKIALAWETRRPEKMKEVEAFLSRLPLLGGGSEQKNP